MDLRGKFTHIFFDADDTLWENEQFFRDAEAKFAELLSDYTGPEGVQQMLWRKQEDNIPLFGYGSKTYMIGMTDAAMELCGGTLPEKIYLGIKEIIKELAFHEFQLIDGVEETLQALQGKYTLVTMNPPYKKVEGGLISPNEGRAIARHEIKCTVTDMLEFF